MLKTIRRHEMLYDGENVVVAVSGGPDSIALLHILRSLGDELGIELHVAHLNHSFRGAESDADAEYVRKFADKLGLECSIEKINVPEIQAALHLSAEEAARVVRYDFLERVAEDVNADRIAVGHNSDDQVETVMMNLLRGTGLDGLTGMPPVRDKIIRPLIEISRAEIEEYAEKHNLRPRTDVSNFSAMYTRNRIRLELLPSLRMNYNPEIDSAILRLSELIRDDLTYLNMTAGEKLRDSIIESEEEILSLDASRILSNPMNIRRRIIREAVRMLAGEIADVGFSHIEEILRLLDTNTNFEYNLPGKIYLKKIQNRLTFSSSKLTEIPIIYCYELPVPGKVSVEEINLKIESEISDEPIEYIREPKSGEIVLDYEAITGKLIIRNWQPGDRIQPLGMQGAKKVQDIFVDNKIPKDARHRIPLIADCNNILWVAGLTMAENAKVADNTRKFLILRVGPV